jgi:Fe-S cluster biogenesis protein NfuA
VHLRLRGACRTCDSSTVTLKNGIEGMLMHYVSIRRMSALYTLS